MIKTKSLTRVVLAGVIMLSSPMAYAVDIAVGQGWESYTYSFSELQHHCGSINSVGDAWVSQGCPGFFTFGPWLNLQGAGDLIISVQLWLYGTDAGIDPEQDVAGMDLGMTIDIANYPTSTHKSRIKGKDKAFPPPTPGIFHYTRNLDQPLWMFENLVNPHGIEFRLFGLHNNIWAHFYKVKFLWLYH